MSIGLGASFAERAAELKGQRAAGRFGLPRPERYVRMCSARPMNLPFPR
jgi:hypothetical protein